MTGFWHRRTAQRLRSGCCSMPCWAIRPSFPFRLDLQGLVHCRPHHTVLGVRAAERSSQLPGRLLGPAAADTLIQRDGRPGTRLDRLPSPRSRAGQGCPKTNSRVSTNQGSPRGGRGRTHGRKLSRALRKAITRDGANSSTPCSRTSTNCFDLLRALYREEAQDAMQFAQHVERMHYPQFRSDSGIVAQEQSISHGPVTSS